MSRSIPHGSSEPSYMLVSPLWSLELLCGILPSWPIFEVPPGSGLWSRAGLRPLVPNGPSSGSQWPVLRFPMAHPLVPNGHPLVPNGPSSGSQWLILWFPMAHSLWSLPWLSVSSSLWSPLWFQAGRPPPRLLALLPSTLTTQSALVLLFSFLFTPSFLVVVYISSRTCILIL
jgi:hypothetical protein